MGDWYVIADIPTFIEDEAKGASERYELVDPGKMVTTLFINPQGFEGEHRNISRPALSGKAPAMRSGAPSSSEHSQGDDRIAYLDEDYSLAIIARDKRDHVWIMARDPLSDDEDYDRLVDGVEAMEYRLDKRRKLPRQARADWL